MKAVHTPLVCIAIVICAACPSKAGKHVFAVRGDQVLLNGKPVKIIGLRCSNALMTDKTTQDLIERLLLYRMNGVNTVGVYFMGSRFGDIKGYRPDASLDPVYAARMGRLIEAADELGMIVLVGCLYWSESRAKEDLVGTWKQADANQAVANTVKWLSEHDYRNIFVDPDNEGMAHDATQWSIAAMIEAGPRGTRHPRRRAGQDRVYPTFLEQGLLRVDAQHPRLVHQPPTLVGPPHPGVVLRRLWNHVGTRGRSGQVRRLRR